MISDKDIFRRQTMIRVLLLVSLLLISFSTKANINKRDLLCLTTTSFNEAKGEDLLGMMLIANVVINRSHEEKTICKVVSKPEQFAYNVSTKIPKDLNEILKVSVMDLYKGKFKIPPKFKTATHFHNLKVKPKWTKKLVYLGVYKHHKFYTAT
jgi:spore germination cell wall hydrolase CwlJ-like protein